MGYVCDANLADMSTASCMRHTCTQFIVLRSSVHMFRPISSTSACAVGGSPYALSLAKECSLTAGRSRSEPACPWDAHGAPKHHAIKGLVPRVTFPSFFSFLERNIFRESRRFGTLGKMNAEKVRWPSTMWSLAAAGPTLPSPPLAPYIPLGSPYSPGATNPGPHTCPRS